jgi:ankyrin repeat protein
LLHQLFAQKPELLGHAVKVSDQNEEDRLKASVDLLWEVLTTAAEDPRAGEIVCILDALDECRYSELKLLLRKLCSFYDGRSQISSSMALKFLVTSRPLYHIISEFSDLSRKIPAIRLAGEDHTDEILKETGLVIEYEIEKIQLDFPMHPKTVCILREEFTKVENRTYLWLMLIFDLIRQDLQSVINATEREKIFHTIPKSVDTAYTAILNKSTDKNRARKLLKIVCAATRPLSVKEVTAALLIQENHKTYDDLEIPQDGFPKAYIRNLCGLFVSVIDERVFLLHQTAKEFLMAKEDCNQSMFSMPSDEIWKNSVSIQDSNLLLASMCMWFISLEEFKDSSIKQDDIDQLVSKYEFFEYSATNWGVHFRATVVSNGSPLLKLAIELCDVQADRHSIFMLVAHKFIMYGEIIDGLCNLHVASFFGLEKIIGQLLASRDIDVNAGDNAGRTALWWAAFKRHQGVIGQLFAAPGIDINAADNEGRTPLSWATSMEQQGIVGQLLAAPGIDINAADNKGRTPLSWAAGMQQQGIVDQLLAAPGIDVNAADNEGRTPLSWAASRQQQGIVGQLLATPSINVNLADTKGKTPLWYAAEEGIESVVGQLLAAPGININAADDESKPPLYWAVFWGHEGVVGQLLAAPGININAADNILRVATSELEMGIIGQLLAAPSIDVNAVDNNGCTPLWWAAFGGHEGVVGQLLAAPSINVNAADDNGCTPLWSAVSQGQKEVLSQLLAAPSIDVNALDNEGRTPLWLAVSQGQKEVASQLLATPSIDVNASDNEGSSPLHWAAIMGYQGVVGQLLAATDINVNVVDNEGNSPLWCAASEGLQGVVSQLLAVPGIDLDVANKDGKTPLSTAQDRVCEGRVYEGRDYEGVIKLLESRILVASKGLDTDST